MINQESGNRSQISNRRTAATEIGLMRLLVVDWSAESRQQLVREAGENGFDVTQCATPAEARKLIEATDFHGVVFDSGLYGESAEEFLHWLDSLGARKPYAVVLTDFEATAAAREWLGKGADDLLPKPLGPGALGTRLAVLEQRMEESAAGERKMAELRRNHARFENLYLESPDAVLVLKNRQGKVIGVNRAVQSTLGYDGKTLLGKYMSLLFPDIFGRDGFASRGDVLSGATVLHAIPYRRPDGGRRMLDIVMSPVPWDQGYAVMMVCRDVTGRESEEGGRVRDSKDEALGRFASGVAGEYGDVLTAIGGNLSLLESAPFLNDEARETIGRAITSCESGRELTAELSAFGGAARPPRRAKVELEKLVERAVQFALFDYEGVRPVFRMVDDLPAISGDEADVRTLVEEISKNAAQAMSDDGGTLYVELTSVSVAGEERLPLGAGEYVKLLFRDNGRGMSDEALGQVFDPYFAEGDDGRRGCGLTRASVIVRRHGGHIEAISQPGEGSCFEIYLPVAAEVAGAGAAAVRQGEGKAPAGLRVLVLDDEPQILRVVEKALGAAGHEVFCTATGEEALRAFEKADDFGRPFDVLLFDLDIRSGMGGRETLARIRATHPRAKAIITTGYVDDTVLENYLEHGFCGVLCKPFRLEHLASAVERLGRGGGDQS